MKKIIFILLLLVISLSVKSQTKKQFDLFKESLKQQESIKKRLNEYNKDSIVTMDIDYYVNYFTYSKTDSIYFIIDKYNKKTVSNVNAKHNIYYVNKNDCNSLILYFAMINSLDNTVIRSMDKNTKIIYDNCIKKLIK